MKPACLFRRATPFGFLASTARAVSALLLTLACASEASTGTAFPPTPPTPPTPPPGPAAVASVEVTPPQLTLEVGTGQTLAAAVKDAAGNVLSRAVTWSTSASAIVTIDTDGKVIAVAPGQATISASSEGKSASVLVTSVARSTVGVASGRVTDTQGRPMAGATIVINNALWYNRNIVLKSGTDGTYRFVLPGTDAWYVRGTAEVEYNGRTYTIELKPDYAAAFAGTEGHVVNLQWTMTGEMPKDFGAGGYYGGEVQMDAGVGLFDLDGVVLTLTPTGPLLDGSAGQVITRRVVGTMGFLRLRDVPIGRYSVRATRNGDPLLIRMRYAASSQSVIAADFEPVYEGATVYGLYFSVALPE